MIDNKFECFFKYKETECHIITDNESAMEVAINSIKYHREKLEHYGQAHPNFLYSLEPIAVSKGPIISKLMAKAAKEANVGPMAAVAGVLADLAVKDMVSHGAKVAVIENGGEASVFSNRPINIALLAGDSPLSKYVGFKLVSFPKGVATSSGVFSHALSFGDAEAVTIFANNAGLADAAATAVGNLIKGSNSREVIQYGIDKALSIKGVEGVFIIYNDFIGKAGQVPQIIKVNTN